VSSELPDVTDLGHGIGVIPLPLPFRSPAWVNAYLIAGSEGWTLIDCGVDWQPGMDRLNEGLDALGVSPASIHSLVVSHLHPDHVGMAPRLTEEHGWQLVMHRNAATLYERYNDTPGMVTRTRDLALRSGVPEPLLGPLTELGPRPAYMPFLDPPDRVVDDGDSIELGGGRRLDVLHTPGHEQSHICLRDSLTGIVFSGDHVLPRITPVIMYDEQVDDVLGDYLTSLQRLVELGIGLTYPAHGTIVERGTARCEQILLHHHRRLDGMVGVVDLGPATSWKVMEQVYRPNLSPLEQRLALRETVSHLEHLRIWGRVSTFHEDGVDWYRR
jgi:glyoxylase-like metal-dependent hydrolase (beta-lactamase superfamily II)